MLNFFFLLNLFSCAENKEALPTAGQLSFLSYNVHGLPSGITGDDTNARMQMIGPMLNNFDIVALQEDWEDENHALLKEKSEHPVQERFSEEIRGVYGSGLSTFSVGTLNKLTQVHFTACHGELDNASECLAAKGFQILRVEVGEGVEIDVYNTHMEAGGSPEDILAARSQVEELLNAINEHSQERPLVFLGDTNLRPSNPTDAEMIEDFMNLAMLKDTCEETQCTETNHIDRIWYRSSAAIKLSAIKWNREISFVDDDNQDLSDHPAISAQIQWDVMD